MTKIAILIVTFCCIPFDSHGIQSEQRLFPTQDQNILDYGHDVSISGNWAIVGAPSSNGQKGNAYVYKFDGDKWSESEKLVPITKEHQILFGISVSISNEQIIVGTFSRYAYVFEYNGSSWVETQLISASDQKGDDRFGQQVLIHEDFAFVGAKRALHNDVPTGAVYVFKYDNGSWIETDKITASDAEMNDDFGHAASFSENSLIVGAIRGGINSTSNSGAAYIFSYDGANWQEQQKLITADNGHYSHFGQAVSIFGNTALVGVETYSPLSPALMFQVGAVFSFEFNGNDWIETQKLMHNDGGLDHRFGTSVSLLGERALIGADHVLNQSNGAAYIFSHDGTEWIQTRKIMPSIHEGYSHFGHSVSLSADRALIGAPLYNIGAAYVFELDIIFSNGYDRPNTQ